MQKYKVFLIFTNIMLNSLGILFLIQNVFGALKYEQKVISDRVIMIILQLRSNKIGLTRADQKDFQNSILKYGDIFKKHYSKKINTYEQREKNKS